MTAPQPTSPASQVDRTERTRRRILEAAGRCFAEDGFAKTTVEGIARAASVSKALVYTYYHGKEELLAAVFEATLEEWAAFTWAEVEREREPSVAGAVAILHRASIEYAREHPFLRSLMNREVSLEIAPDLRPLARRTQERWRGRLVALLERGIANGELRSDLDAPRMADVIRLLHMAFLDRLFDPDPIINVTNPELIETSVKVLHGGILK